MRWGIASAAVAAAVLLAACGGDGGDDGEGAASAGGALADRILSLGEDRETRVEVLQGQIPVDLSEILNPGVTSDTPQEDLIALPVHQDGTLVGSFRIERPDGVVTFYLLYDVPQDDLTVEQQLLRDLDETPWQVVAGQSTVTQAAIRFQSTLSSDINGTAFIRAVAVVEGADGAAGPLTSAIYIVEVRPPELSDAPDFELPSARPVPEDFPAPFLLLADMTPISVLWSSQAAGDSYQLVLLTRESAFDIAEQYRDRLEAEGWELVDDRAVGFATVLDFQSDDGRTQVTVTADAFADDDLYTSVLLELLVSSRSAAN